MDFSSSTEPQGCFALHKALLMTFTVTEVSGSFAMGDKSEIVKNVKYLYLKLNSF